MSVLEGSEELERPPRRTPTLCLMSTVVVGDAQHPGKLPERRVLLDLSIGGSEHAQLCTRTCSSDGHDF